MGRIEKMSKSKRNTIDPGTILDRYGADTARLFVLSDNPPERDFEWTEAGIAGTGRFVQRLYRTVLAVAEEPGVEGTDGAGLALRQATHRTIAAVTAALEAFSFNVAIARLHELTGALADAVRDGTATAGVAARGGGRAGVVDGAVHAASGRNAAQGAASRRGGPVGGRALAGGGPGAGGGGHRDDRGAGDGPRGGARSSWAATRRATP